MFIFDFEGEDEYMALRGIDFGGRDMTVHECYDFGSDDVLRFWKGKPA